jgi:hypothetical protein
MFIAVWSEGDQFCSGPLSTAEYVFLSLIIVQSNILRNRISMRTVCSYLTNAYVPRFFSPQTNFSTFKIVSGEQRLCLLGTEVSLNSLKSLK